MQFRMFGDLRLQKDDALLRIETGGQVVDHDLDAVLGDSAGVGVVAGQRVPVGYEVEAVVRRIVLQADPILQRAEIVADVQPAGGAHAADYSLCFCFRTSCQSVPCVRARAEERPLVQTPDLSYSFA